VDLIGLLLLLLIIVVLPVALVLAAAKGVTFVLRAFDIKIQVPRWLTVAAVIVCVTFLSSLLLTSSSLRAPGASFPTPIVTPFPVRTPLPVPTPSPDFAEIVRQQLTRLSQGEIAFNPPSSVRTGDITRIEARIARTIGELGLTQGMLGPGVPQVEVLRVSSFMGTELSGENFDIKALNDASQIVEEGTPTQWAWDVKATKPGKQMLHLKVWARILAPPLPEQVKDLPVLDRAVDVQVNPAYSATQFWENNWQWVLGSGFSASAVAVIWKLRDRVSRSLDGRTSKRRSQVRPLR
jgi:hypothetical protein